jgi:hypothetical protein
MDEATQIKLSYLVSQSSNSSLHCILRPAVPRRQLTQTIIASSRHQIKLMYFHQDFFLITHHILVPKAAASQIVFR